MYIAIAIFSRLLQYTDNVRVSFSPGNVNRPISILYTEIMEYS